ILARLASGTLTITEAAQLLGVTDRQVRRIRDSYSTEELSSVVHGNNGRAPLNKTNPATTARIVELAGIDGPYSDFNTCHLKQMLSEREGILIGRSTLDRLLFKRGLRKRSRSRERRVYTRR